jgi:NAD+ diphosphatase
VKTPETLGFANGRYDRAAYVREQPEELAALARRPEARTFVFCGEVPVIARHGETLDPLFPVKDYPGAGSDQEMIFLGLDNGAPRFAVEIPAQLTEPLNLQEDVVLIDQRSVAVQDLFDGTTHGAMATAKALMFWHRTHGFCGQCGKPSVVAKAGWQRNCPACGAQHFPRTDPVVIMLAVDGERCLLGRQSRFAPGWYSCLAGFVEPGETIEAAVRREVKEEADIEVGAVDYLFSQPWPFPESLMIGCLAQAKSEKITVDTSELEDVRWFSREDVRLMIAGTHPDGLHVPVKMSIASHILGVWANGEGEDAGTDWQLATSK